MVNIINKKECTGCSACLNICKVKAIEMTADHEGFLYPKIKKDICVSCNQCTGVCPIINYDELNPKYIADCMIQKVYAVKNKDMGERLSSSSGGVFCVFAEYVLNSNGVVAGASFNDKLRIAHQIVTKKEDLWNIKGSKYAQSDIDFLFLKIKQQLDEGKSVLFTGMSCQVEGLRAYLKKDYDKLICIDTACLGIPSPGVWEIYLKTYFKDKEIEAVNFKEKSVGWRKFSFMLKEKDGTCFIQDGRDNYFMQSMFKHLSLRPSCFACRFKSTYRAADITLADCWGVDKVAPEMDDDKGLSTVLIHSKKGNDMFEVLKDKFECKEFPVDMAAEGNPYIIQSIKKSKMRIIFFLAMRLLPKKFVFWSMCCNPNRFPWGKIKGKLGGVKKLVKPSYYKLNKKEFDYLYNYDKKFNASFRGKKGTLSYMDKKSCEMRYIRLYRQAQTNRNNIWGKLYYHKLIRMSLKTGMKLHDNLNIGKGLIIGHCGTIVLNDEIKFGTDIMLTHGVTIGRDIRGNRKGAPTIGNRVCIRTNSTVVGKITIGDDVLIAPNTFVNFDVPSHSVVIGNPATIHYRKNATEGHLGIVD